VAAPSGVGIGLRRPIYDEVLRSRRRIDWLEIIPENFMGHGGRAASVLDACLERWPVVAHGVALSLGGPDPLDDAYISALAPLLDRLGTTYFSEHLSYSAVHGVRFHELLPLPFSEEAALHAALRVREVSSRLGIDIVLENISYYAIMPGSTLGEGEFIRAVLEESGAGLLLDVSNVYVNAKNHGRDPTEALLSLPLEHTRQIHLAGFRREGDLLLDDHASAVADEVWPLYREALRRVGPVPVLIEWDQAIAGLDPMLDEADKARRILEEMR
jgi:uncharacterized protein (UPF0276 family)